jgi:hypothetical protein
MSGVSSIRCGPGEHEYLIMGVMYGRYEVLGCFRGLCRLPAVDVIRRA